MTKSASYRALVSRVYELRRIYLPRSWDPLGVYRELQRERATAFTVLVHAEIEDYIESSVRRRAEDRFRAWRDAGDHSETIQGFVRVAFIDAPKKAAAASTLQEVVALGRQQVGARISNNHGLRTSNIKSLLESVALEVTMLPVAVLGTLDTLGRERGLYAHTSGSTRKSVNPKDEWDRAILVLTGLISFDKLVAT